MKSNIIAFTGSAVVYSTEARAMIRNNVVSLSALKKTVHPMRAPEDAFSVTNVLCTTGEIA